MNIFCKKHILLLVLLFCASLVIATGCGKKGPPTLRAFAQPEPIREIRAVHRDGKVNISWSYNNANQHIVISGIRLYRAEGSNGYVEIAKLPAGARSYADANIAYDKQYRYKLRVFTARNIESGDSAALAVRPVSPPEVPSGINYRIVGNNIEIEWDRTDEGTFFNIYRSAAKGSYQSAPVNEKPLSRPYFRDTLNLRAPVYYVIVAVKQTDIANESGLSAELVIDPKTFTPKPPVDLRYVRSGNRGYLTWKDSEEPYVKGYRVYRRKEPFTRFELIGEVNVPVYLDEERVGSRTTYRVTAVGPLKESRPSAEVGAGQVAE